MLQALHVKPKSLNCNCASHHVRALCVKIESKLPFLVTMNQLCQCQTPGKSQPPNAVVCHAMSISVSHVKPGVRLLLCMLQPKALDIAGKVFGH